LEYEGYDRLKKTRGFALGLFGSFIFAFSSVVVTVRQQPVYLLLGVLSVSALTMAYMSIRTGSITTRFLFLVSTGGILAAEASAVMLYFLAADAFIYTVATLVGSWLALKGVSDMESLKVDDYYWKKKREATRELTV
jgi:hypothetical protein